MKFVISKKSEGAYQFFLKNAENKPVLWSPRFATKNQCLDGIAHLRRHVQAEPTFDKWQTDSGRYVFHLKSNDGHLLAMSAPFGSKFECVRHISEVKENISSEIEGDVSY
ncbi:YegP family protein [Alkalitalea saponilacus]|uniref:DUF1508 domain-containing protein n=1 Tax=Alkalitalea saponilacus TaxID=889453 RepID=A0A1T5HS68_9BACT|nr:DUF1508 domain-containing protein [Alkalitalea saponilacus]ASB50003.1 hypothetical protein CDL62_13085 [Alkalitalea saponilacus]SKC23487.1 hypothetical protein SAMN03080601_02761 [Alkalitalea saponilacus]